MEVFLPQWLRVKGYGAAPPSAKTGVAKLVFRVVFASNVIGFHSGAPANISSVSQQPGWWGRRPPSPASGFGVSRRQPGLQIGTSNLDREHWSETSIIATTPWRCNWEHHCHREKPNIAMLFSFTVDWRSVWQLHPTSHRNRSDGELGLDWAPGAFGIGV